MDINEAVLPIVENLGNGENPYFPRSWSRRLRNSLSSEEIRLIGRVVAIRTHRSEVAAGFGGLKSYLSPLLSCIWLMWDSSISREESEAAQALESYRTRVYDFAMTGPPYEPVKRDDILNDLVRLWERSSLQMYAICAANGIVYLHYLQPNQYVPNKKVLSSGEMRSAYRPEDSKAEVVGEGYPRLIRNGEHLLSQGVRFSDLTGIYADVSETVYTDICCHVNRLGYSIVAEVITADIVSEMKAMKGGR